MPTSVPEMEESGEQNRKLPLLSEDLYSSVFTEPTKAGVVYVMILNFSTSFTGRKLAFFLSDRFKASYPPCLHIKQFCGQMSYLWMDELFEIFWFSIPQTMIILVPFSL